MRSLMLERTLEKNVLDRNTLPCRHSLRSQNFIGVPNSKDIRFLVLCNEGTNIVEKMTPINFFLKFIYEAIP